MIDECHRGSAAEDSAWREILDYFASATQIGMTATPKETEYLSAFDELPAAQRLGWFPDPEGDLLDELAVRATPGDRILVKGSNRIFWARDFVGRLVVRLEDRE